MRALVARYPLLLGFCFAFVGPLIVLGALAEEVADREPFSWDGALSSLGGVNSDVLDTVMLLFTGLGGGVGLWLLATPILFALLWQRRIGQAIFAAVAVLGAEVIERVLKDVFDRPRPAGVHRQVLSLLSGYRTGLVALLAGALVLAWAIRWRRSAIILLGGLFLVGVVLSQVLVPSLTPAQDSSFPSGHATGSMALAAAAVTLAWPTRWRWQSLSLGPIFLLGVGLSRLYFGVHYPSDIVAGWSLALAWVAGLRLALPARLFR